MNKLTPTETIELCEAMRSVGYNMDKIAQTFCYFIPYFTIINNTTVIDTDPIKDLPADATRMILLCELHRDKVPIPTCLDDQWHGWKIEGLMTYREHRCKSQRQVRRYDQNKRLISDKICEYPPQRG